MRVLIPDAVSSRPVSFHHAAGIATGSPLGIFFRRARLCFKRLSMKVRTEAHSDTWRYTIQS